MLLFGCSEVVIVIAPFFFLAITLLPSFFLSAFLLHCIPPPTPSKSSSTISQNIQYMNEKSSKPPLVPSLDLSSILPRVVTQVPPDEERASFEVEPSWQEQPVHLPPYTPSEADKDNDPRDSPPTTPVDDPIHIPGSKKHFGFSSRQSRATSIFPWQKHKPAVCHQYAPHRPPLSKRSSLSRLKVLPVMHPDPVLHLEEEEIDLL